MLLQDQIVLISGIGPGLGIKLALEAARQGAGGIVLAARTPAKLERAAADIAALGGSAGQTPTLIAPCDITQPADCARLVQDGIARFGRMDALINSAYLPGEMSKTADKGDLQDWRAVMETNLFGTMNLTHAAAAQMKKQKRGSIVMISSMVTRKPFYGQAGYAASKGAVNAVTKYLATDLGRYGIRVNGAAMGWMWGHSVEHYFTQRSKTEGRPLEELKAEVYKNIPLGRIPTDDECAKAALFLASDLASAVTGVCLDVNGGEFMAP